MRRVLRRLFEASGFTVITYASGAELLASPQPDEAGCIVLDLQMPGVNGLELQKQLAERAPPFRWFSLRVTATSLRPFKR